MAIFDFNNVSNLDVATQDWNWGCVSASNVLSVVGLVVEFWFLHFSLDASDETEEEDDANDNVIWPNVIDFQWWNIGKDCLRHEEEDGRISNLVENDTRNYG